MIDMQQARPSGTERGRAAPAPLRAIRWWLGELDGAWRDARALLVRAPHGADGLVLEASAESFTIHRQSGAGVLLAAALVADPHQQDPSMDLKPIACLNRRQALALAAAGAVMPAAAQSTGFPNKTVRIIVPYTTGGSNDVIARLLAQQLQTQWGQAVVVVVIHHPWR